jgi:N-carbamoyl-L-amino-acid hydrolase
MKRPRINAQRLWDDIMTTARFGGTEKGGIRRLTLDAEDIRARDWLKTQCDSMGCTLTVDELGNMFAVRPGRNNGLAPIAIGSHLDTQPSGGKFDGILGVIAGLEALRTLNEHGLSTQAPLMLINWTNEEGSRFSPAMLSSGVYAGVFDREYAHGRTDRQGIRFDEALANSGYRGPAAIGSVRFGAMFELHIEQGPILEAEGIPIGVVQGAQAVRWYDVTITGRSAHTGTTPMHLRKNALLGAARIIEAVNDIALSYGPRAVATVGVIEVKPNSRNVIPGTAIFSVDLRHPEDAILAEMQTRLHADVQRIAATLDLQSRVETVWDSPAVLFDPGCIAAVRAGAASAGFATRDITSGAGHDSVYVARVAPTTMIFVPSVGGLSHNEAEYTSPEDCSAGAQVLLNAVLAYDDAQCAAAPSA